MALGRPAWTEARTTLQQVLSADEASLRDNEAVRKEVLIPRSSIYLPCCGDI